MKLTKEEIQFIDNYLIKNKVKYWDVRLELLDHIVSSVEDKITIDGISLNEALLEVHEGFGNRTKTFGVESEKLLKYGLYVDSNGFKVFTRKKQKELSRKYRKINWRHLKSKLSSIKFLIEYIAFVLLFLTIYKFSPKSCFLIGLTVLILPNVYSIYYLIKYKSARKSLSFAMATGSAMLVWSIYNLSFYILKEYYENTANMPQIIFVGVTCLFYPLVRTNIEVYKEVNKENKNIYNLKFL